MLLIGIGGERFEVSTIARRRDDFGICQAESSGSEINT
jgi:hypothetical protein